MVTADQRLDQLEPLLSEAITVSDRHTAQLKQYQPLFNQLVVSVAGQRGNVGFALHQLIEIKVEQAEAQARLAGVENKMAGSEGKIAIFAGQQGSLAHKLDLIFGRLGDTSK